MQSLLKTYFGYDTFRPLQEEIIHHILEKKEALVIMATGGGKSLCYQLPALKFPGLTLVVSPLIALMKDQVDSLQSNGIEAAFLNSTLSPESIHKIEFQLRNGKLKILYVTPERLALAAFQGFLKTLKIDLIAIDEAHCISEWGHDFRPDYRNLKSLRKNFPGVPLVALTATATDQVRNDIIGQLSLQNARTFLSSFNRSNLSYQIKSKKKALPELIALLKKYQGESAIIYCFSRKNTEELAEALNSENIKAAAYHAGLDQELRRKTQEQFIHDEIPVIVATIAFGMGIDKPNVRLVVHFDLPKSVESYYQETGRAGRDGLQSECVFFYSYGDKIKHNFFINKIEDAAQRKSASEKLGQMIEYAEMQSCRRAYLLKYFGERYELENCQSCDYCLAEKENFDATEISWKILSTIIRLEERFGTNYVLEVMLGKDSPKIQERKHQKIPVFGIAQNYKSKELKQIINLLLAKKILVKTAGEYPLLKVSAEGKKILKLREKIILTRSDSVDDQESSLAVTRANWKKKSSQKTLDYHHDLFEELRILRKKIADQKRVPPFIIFGDVSLQEMSYYLPQDPDTFLSITGVGRVKLAEYGKDFLNIIQNYADKNKLVDLFLSQK